MICKERVGIGNEEGEGLSDPLGQTWENLNGGSQTGA